jgi:hypothetical protein
MRSPFVNHIEEVYHQDTKDTKVREEGKMDEVNAGKLSNAFSFQSFPQFFPLSSPALVSLVSWW